jgi:hypothetical protein
VRTFAGLVAWMLQINGAMACMKRKWLKMLAVGISYECGMFPVMRNVHQMEVLYNIQSFINMCMPTFQDMVCLGKSVCPSHYT